MSVLRLTIFFAACVLVAHCATWTVSAYDESALGPKICAKGPQHWCKDLRTAKQCGAVGHCIQTVWEKTKMKPDDSEVCETCKRMVQEARDQLLSNETGQEIRQVLEGTCHIYFPIKVLADQCVKFVDEFAVELIEMLSSRMDPLVICSTVGLCNSAKLRQFWDDVKIVESKVSVGDDCVDCKTFVNDAIRKLRTMNKEDVRAKVKEVCDMIGGAAGRACKIAVSLDFDEIYNYLLNLNADELCKFTDMCSNGKRPLFKLKRNGKVGDIECDFCVQIVDHFKQAVTQNSTKEEVHDILLGLCKSAGKYKGQCVDFVNDYFNEIYDFIANELDGQLICSTLGFCGKKPGKEVAMTPLVPAKKSQIESEQGIIFTGNDEENSAEQEFSKKKDLPFFPKKDKRIEVFTKFPASKEIASNPVSQDAKRGCTCVLCEYVLHDIQKILMDQTTDKSIKHAVEKVCSLAPKAVREECVDFIEDYGDSLLALFAQQLDPSVICVQLHVCASVNNAKKDDKSPPSREEVPLFQLPPERLMPQSLANTGQASCMLCQYVMGMLHTLISHNASRKDLVYGLDNLCHLYPQKERDLCDRFIDEYGEMIAGVLEHAEPSQICAFLAVCPHNSPNQVTPVPIENLNFDKCGACVMVVDYLEKLLQNTTVDQEIAKALEQVCDIVPGSIREMCKAYIEAYGPALIQLLVELKDSKQVCQALELCEPTPGTVQLLGSKRCTYGPSYWCISKLHAQACKAEEHCKKHVWKAVQ
jgi:saposin